MKLPLCSALISLFLITSCGKRGDDSIVHREGNPDYHRVGKEGEAVMNAAIAKALAEIDVFIASLQAPKPSQTYFSVKKPIPWQDGVVTSHEHIWVTDVTFKDGKFHGKLGNEPVDVKDLKLGDDVVVEKAEASDWMIVEDNVLVGGYTLLALRDQMPESERVEFDASMPFKLVK